MHRRLRDPLPALPSDHAARGKASPMTRWDAPMGGNPLRTLKDGRPRTLRCKILGCVEHQGCYMPDDCEERPGCACGHGTCTRCGRLLLDEDDCEALVIEPTLRCRLFGCKPGGDELVHEITTTCSCGRGAFVVGPDGYGVVHEGCCVRCGQPIVPTARVMRRQARHGSDP